MSLNTAVRRSIWKLGLRGRRCEAWCRFLGSWLRPGRPGKPDGPRPSVLWISVDSLRADHLVCYGYGRPTSPTLSRLAEDGWLFHEVIAPAPWTLGSLGSVFTGVHPTVHGADLPTTDRDGGSQQREETCIAPIHSSLPTLPELFCRGGYDTAAFTQPGLVWGPLGFARGFGMYRDDLWGVAHQVLEAGGWVGRRETRPFFAFLHTFNAHYPYLAPRKYRRRFDRANQAPSVHARFVQEVNAGRERLGHEEILALLDRYDAAVAYVDRWIGVLIELLRRKRLLDRTLLVVSADHGEAFMEHGLIGHGACLHNEVLRVPLLIHYPPWGRGVVRSQVRLLDLFPTLLEAASIPAPAHSHGESLMPLLRGDDRRARPALSQQWKGGAAFAYQDGQWKVIWHPQEGRAQLFHVKEDRREEHDLSMAFPERTRELMERARRWMDHWPDPTRSMGHSLQSQAIPLTGALARQLHGLGYL